MTNYSQISVYLVYDSSGQFFFSIKKKYIFNWRIIALQCCVGFCHTTRWISCKYTLILSLLNLPPNSHPINCQYLIDFTLLKQFLAVGDCVQRSNILLFFFLFLPFFLVSRATAQPAVWGIRSSVPRAACHLSSLAYSSQSFSVPYLIVIFSTFSTCFFSFGASPCCSFLKLVSPDV